MKRLRFFVTLATALVIAATFSFADEGETHHRFKLKVDADSEAIVIDDLEVGETRQFFTDSGKEVLVTRKEDGLELTVDGKEIEVATPHGLHGAAIVDVDSEDGEHVNVFVKTLVAPGDGEEGEHAFVWHGEGGEHATHDVTVWTGEEGESHASVSIAVAPDIAEKVLESGALDDLDPATRDKVLEAIRDAATPRLHKKVIVHEEEDHDH